MPLFYPHKQTAIIFIVCAIGVLGTVWYVNRGNINLRKTPDDLSANKVIQATQAGSNFATTSEWQKQFFSNSSTSVMQLARENIKNNSIADEPETVTGKFGKKFFEQYMILKQNDLIDDKTAVQAVIDQNMNDLVSTAPQARTYDIRSVLISPTSDIADEKTYGNTIGSILSLHIPQKDAAIIAMEALEQNDPSRIKEIVAISNSYSEMVKKLLATPAPKTLSQSHLNLINAASSMIFVSEGMSKVFEDPIQSMISIAVYEKSFASMYNSLLDLKYIFSQKLIQFSNNEPGIIFTTIN
jgi:hypothetical protein